MQNRFNSVELKRPRRNAFDLSHDRKYSFNMGKLTPTLCLEVSPGEKFTASCSNMIRFSPLIAPIMHNVTNTIHVFYCRTNILWDGFEHFITGAVDGTLNTDLPEFPYLLLNTVAKGSVADFLGCPVGDYTGNPLKVSAVPFAMVARVWNEFYRDQNLQDPLNWELEDGNNTVDINAGSLPNRCWEHDYFTSALPFVQKGDPVRLPFTGRADLVFDPNIGSTQLVDPTGDPSALPTVAASPGGTGVTFQASDLQEIRVDVTANTFVDAASIIAPTVNDLRVAEAVQEYLERSALGGSRYAEYVLAMYGVRSPDGRLNRPEYLGGFKTPVVISEVLQTSQSTPEVEGSTPQGNMAGHALSIGQSRTFSAYFTEHGYIIAFQSVMPKTAYQQGLPKHFFKFSPYDYINPIFAHLGEQPVKNVEIYADTDEVTRDQIFGYQSRFAEYTFVPSTVHGEFTDELSYWHMGRIFDSLPALNAEFVAANPTTRIFGVVDPSLNDKLYAHTIWDIMALRQIPKYSDPRLT